MAAESFEKEYYESEEFWKEGMIEDPFNQGRIDKTLRLIPTSIESLVDIGCGNGRLLSQLHELRPNLKLLGVDRSHAALKYVPVEKIEADILSSGLGDSTYDCVTCCEVIEHLPGDVFSKTLGELTRISSKYVLISVPYMEDLAKDQEQCPQCKSQFNSNLHVRSFSDKDMIELLDQYGFRNKSIQYAGEMIRSKGSQFFRRKVQKGFDMPICPICGYKNKEYKIVPYNSRVNTYKTSIIRKGLNIMKQIWPKNRSFYWIIALYERI